jgi:hydrogenase nickel incorporation protein HypA/HybF
MHELSIANEIVHVTRDHVPAEQLPQVVAVRVRLGRLSGVVADSLSFCFDAIVGDTPLRQARLDLEDVPTIGECADCATRFEIGDLTFTCPCCRSPHVRVVSGADLQIVHIELEDHAPARTSHEAA